MMTNVFQNLLPYIVPMAVGAVSVVVSAVLVFFAVKIIRRQIKLYNSIRLVELKSSKVRYWAFIVLIGFFLFYLTSQIFDPEAPEFEIMHEALGMQLWQCNVTISFAILLLVCCEVFLISLAMAKSAVVDKGIYTEFSYMDWYHVHDYIIDEDRGLVILSGNKYTFQTLDDTTSPLRVAKNDIPKLKFILNKNKNKFSGFEKEGI